MKPKRKERPVVKSEFVILRVPPELKRALEEAAAAERRGLSDYLRLALEDLVAKRKPSKKGGK
ncbi:MAG: ribbon-helix-helix protein, CopG family [Planctomycetia bacterium]|nr:ribbon-helix-helix protein, CopG family [Planctomycetia bacterium]